MTRRVLSIKVARAAPRQINGQRVLTAIGKRSVKGRVGVLPLGLDGDEQADLSVHGGPGKAVYAYPSEHLPFWQTVRAQAGVAAWGDVLAPGMVGENLTLAGLLETDAFIGDVLHHQFQLMKPEWSTLACTDRELSRKTRVRLIEEHAERGTRLLPAHFPAPTAGRIVRRGSAYRYAFD